MVGGKNRGRVNISTGTKAWERSRHLLYNSSEMVLGELPWTVTLGMSWLYLNCE